MSTASDVSELTPIAAAGINSSSTTPTTASRNDAEKHMQAEEKVENLSSSDCNSSGNGIGDFKNELIVVLVLTLSLMAVGFNIGFTSSSIADLMNEGRLNANTASWFASLSLLGSVLGSGLGGVMADLWGRKLPFILETAIAAVGWWLIVADFHVSMLLLGRLLCGIQAGISSTVVSVYLVETMTEARRSSTVACGNLVIQAGELMAFVFRLFLSWRWLAIVAICLALLFAIAATILLPESPRWYIRHGKSEEAKKSLMWLRMGDQMKVDKEMTAMESSVANSGHSKSGGVKQLLQNISQSWRQLLLAILVALAIPLSCHVAIISFVWQIAESAGLSNQRIITVAMGSLQISVAALMVIVVRYASRHACLLIGGTVVSVSLVVLALADLIQQQNWIANTSVASLVALMVFSIGYSVSWGAVAYLIFNEVLPNAIRSHGAGLTVIAIYLVGFVSTQSFMPLQGILKPFGVFIMYAVFNTVVLVVVVRLLPDTSNKSLEDIEKHYIMSVS